MGQLMNVKDTVSLVETPTINESVCEMQVEEKDQDFLKEIIHDPSTEERKFIVSLSDMEAYRQTQLKDADVSETKEHSLKNCAWNLMMFTLRALLI